MNKALWPCCSSRYTQKNSSTCGLFMMNKEPSTSHHLSRWTPGFLHHLSTCQDEQTTKTHISRTSFICWSLAFLSWRSGSQENEPVLSSCLTMSSTSCSCLGRLSFSWPFLKPPYFSNSSKNLQLKVKIMFLWVCFFLLCFVKKFRAVLDVPF